jgi:hypothetical protein
MQVEEGLEEKIEVRIKRILDEGGNALVRMGPLDETLEGLGIYLSQPLPLKGNFKYIYRQIGGPLRDSQIMNRTLSEIEDLLLGLKHRPVIVVDHIESLSSKPALSYFHLYRGGYRFVAIQRKRYVRHSGDPEVRRFLDSFKLANPEFIKDMVVERDLTPVVVLVASLVFLGYFFKAFLLAENSPNSFYIAIIGLSWAVFLLARTIIYISYARRGGRGRR